MLHETMLLIFWNAMAKIFSDTQHQHCWAHKTVNVLASLSKGTKPKLKLNCRRSSHTREPRNAANKILDVLSTRFSVKYPAAMKRLKKYREELLVSYDLPSEQEQ
ncbi:MAG: transposase [Arsenophonus sp. NEOnobi-MAG3]